MAALAGPQTALVALSHVAYRSGFVLDLPGITRVAHDVGALALWDLSHSVGAVRWRSTTTAPTWPSAAPTSTSTVGRDPPPFSTYEPSIRRHCANRSGAGWAGLIRSRWLRALPPPRASGRCCPGTPPVLGLTAVAAGLELIAEAGIAAIRAKAIALGEYAISLADAWLRDLGVTIASPRESARRGAHVALAHGDARELCARLAQAGVIVDFRGPDVIRVGLSPLTTSFADVHTGLSRLRELLGSG